MAHDGTFFNTTLRKRFTGFVAEQGVSRSAQEIHALVSVFAQNVAKPQSGPLCCSL
jgi:hypothetical protein